MKLTKKKAIELHRELWDWLYKTEAKFKFNWPKWPEITQQYGEIEYFCFPCHYVGYRGHDCDRCILCWPKNIRCSDVSSIYTKWYRAAIPKTRKKYAKIIRDLPEIK